MGPLLSQLCQLVSIKSFFQKILKTNLMLKFLLDFLTTLKNLKEVFGKIVGVSSGEYSEIKLEALLEHADVLIKVLLPLKSEILEKGLYLLHIHNHNVSLKSSLMKFYNRCSLHARPKIADALKSIVSSSLTFYCHYSSVPILQYTT